MPMKLTRRGFTSLAAMLPFVTQFAMAARAGGKGRGTLPERKDYGLNAFVRLEIGTFSLQTWYRDSERGSGEGYGPAGLAFLREARWQDRSWVTEAKYDCRDPGIVQIVQSLH